jgi:hypothetical protein
MPSTVARQVTSSTYDAQDRLLLAGTTSYTYTLNGDLQRKRYCLVVRQFAELRAIHAIFSVMTTSTTASSMYKGHRFPQPIISHAVWLSSRFSLSYRDVEEVLAERGIVVTYETVRQWCLTFGQAYATQLRRRRARPGDQWFLDEVFLKINGERHSLWRAVDQDGTVLDILVQSRRNKAAAKRFFRKLLKECQDVPRLLSTGDPLVGEAREL